MDNNGLQLNMGMTPPVVQNTQETAKIENNAILTPPVTPTESQNTPDVDTVPNATTAKPPDEATDETTDDTPVKGIHIITYIGNGTWYDAERKVWARTNKSDDIRSERRYTEEEFADRDDLRYMIQYGSMKEQIV